MASGFRRKRGDDEYVFVDGRALRADEVVRIDLSESAVPGQEEASAVPGAKESANTRTGARRAAIPGQKEAAAQQAAMAAAATSVPGAKEAGVQQAASVASPADAAKAASGKKAGRRFGKGKAQGGKKSSMADALSAMEQEDAFALTDEAQAGDISFAHAEHLMLEDRRKLHRKYFAFGIALVLLICASLTISATKYGTFYTPGEILGSLATWFQLTFTQLTNPNGYTAMYRQVNIDMPYYSGCIMQAWLVLDWAVCGALLALSGMLYQNTFRNPIAAPSMLGVSNGMNMALLILVLQYGWEASSYTDLYYIYSIIGGVAVLLLVLLGGKWISGKGRFNVVNMILMGTIVSQLLGIIMTYVQSYIFDDSMYEAFSNMQNATGQITTLTYVSLIVGTVVALVPIFLFRFKLNLVSFSDDETRLLGVNPNKLRILALGCGSVMILIAQLHLGQVAMVSLIIPFIVRAVFGSEFRKQLGGNILVGAVLLLACACIGMVVQFDGYAIGISPVANIIVIPLFVWMLAIRQKSWE